MRRPIINKMYAATIEGFYSWDANWLPCPFALSLFVHTCIWMYVWVYDSLPIYYDNALITFLEYHEKLYPASIYLMLSLFLHLTLLQNEHAFPSCCDALFSLANKLSLFYFFFSDLTFH